MYNALGISYPRRNRGLTQLEVGLFASWVEQSGDVDKDIQEWLMRGTPMGVEEQMQPRGVFPPVGEPTPPELRRPLDVYHQGFTHYNSLDDEPEGTNAFLDLVESGFVREFSSYAEVISFLGGQERVTSKLAVVTNESGG